MNTLVDTASNHWEMKAITEQHNTRWKNTSWNSAMKEDITEISTIFGMIDANGLDIKIDSIKW